MNRREDQPAERSEQREQDERHETEDAALTPSDTANRSRTLVRLARTYGLLLVVLAVGVFFHFMTDGLFFSSRNVLTLARQTAVLGIVAVGVTPIIVSGEIDLSIGSAVGLCAITVAYTMDVWGWSVPVAIAATALVGLLIGLWQGFAVAGLGIPSFVVTLGGLLIFRGIGLVITQGRTISSFPDSFLTLGQGMIGYVIALTVIAIAAGALVFQFLRHLRGTAGIEQTARSLVGAVGAAALGAFVYLGRGLPAPVAIWLVIALVLGFVMSKITHGRHLYAIGGNREAAQLAGIPAKQLVFGSFIGMGLLYAAAGLVAAARLDGAPPQGIPFLELDAIAASVIGGTSLYGGVGTIGGAVLGATLLQTISNGLSLMNVGSFYQLIVSGLVLVGAVFVDTKAKKQQ